MKEEKKTDKAFLLYHKFDRRLFCFGEGDIFIGKKGLYSFCRQDELSHFEYGNTSNILVGKIENEDSQKGLPIKRFVVFQLH